MSLDIKPEKQMMQEESNSENINQFNSSYIHLQLLQRLARGEISQEVFLQVINSLRLKSNSTDFNYY